MPPCYLGIYLAIKTIENCIRTLGSRWVMYFCTNKTLIQLSFLVCRKTGYIINTRFLVFFTIWIDLNKTAVHVLSPIFRVYFQCIEWKQNVNLVLCSMFNKKLIHMSGMQTVGNLTGTSNQSTLPFFRAFFSLLWCEWCWLRLCLLIFSGVNGNWVNT